MNDHAQPDAFEFVLPAALAEYAEQLLVGTGLDASDAVRIAAGECDAPPALHLVQAAIRAGWQLLEELG